MQPHGGMGREGAARPKGRALPPRYQDVIFAIEPGDPALPPHVRGSLEHPRR